MKEIRKGKLFERYEYGKGPDVPGFIRKKAAGLESGTIIAVIGFDGDEFLEEAEKAVLLNFTLAVHAGWLDVEVCSNGKLRKINRTNIRSRLEKFSQKEGREKNRFLAVFNNLQTFVEGTKNTLPGPFQDCEVIIRHGNGLRSRVAIWRNGMLITNNHPAFQKVHFEGRKPFDATVVLDGSKKEGKAHDLVRDAESRLHNEVEERRIQDENRRRLLTSRSRGGLLHKIRDLIKKHTQKINMEETELDDLIISNPGIEEQIEIARRRAMTRLPGGDNDNIIVENGSRKKRKKTERKRKLSLREQVKKCDVQGKWISSDEVKLRVQFRENVGHCFLVFDFDAGSDLSCESLLKNSEVEITAIKEAKIKDQSVEVGKEEMKIGKIHIKHNVKEGEVLDMDLKVESQKKKLTLLCDVFPETPSETEQRG